MKPGLIKVMAFSAIIAALLLMCSAPAQNKINTADLNAYLEEITISQLQKQYDAGAITIRKVVEDYLKRIDALDKDGPHLNSIICLNPDALSIADELDRELKSGRKRSPLHGIPVILKDNIDTHDKMPTTAGATVLRNSIPEKDSQVAKKLREAGAVIIGKANLSEWANFRASRSSSGWSGTGGQTRNPYVLDRNPCGSSSGSAVAVAANLCVVAIGTETDGSIVCPSNNNGIVGIKPTVGLISRSGIVPISFTQDTPGPMCRSVEDAAIMLGLLSGIDSTDSKTIMSAGKALRDYSGYLKKDGLKGKRIGFLKDELGFSSKVDSLFMQAVSFMKHCGAEVIVTEGPKSSTYSAASYQVLLYEFKDGINKYFESLGQVAPVRNLAELIEFNKKDTIELKYFDQKIFESAQAKGDLKSKEYTEALAKMLRATRENGIDKIMNEHKLDALISPTGSAAWKTDLLLGDHFVGGNSSLAAISGYPAITVPMGFVENLPVNITFFGRAWSEPVLIEIAYSYEQGTNNRRPPRFITSD
jgi:amidase